MHSEDRSPVEPRDVVADLRMYATHFAPSDWDYTRNLGALERLVYSDENGRFGRRLARALGALVRVRLAPWERTILGTDHWSFRYRLASFRVRLRRDRHLPDGVLDSGCVITAWEETGEYLQMVQPSVGALVADLLAAHPNLPETQAVVVELQRISNRYAARLSRDVHRSTTG